MVHLGFDKSVKMVAGTVSISCGGRCLSLKDLWRIWQSCSGCCRRWSYWKGRRSPPRSEAGGPRGQSGRSLKPGFGWPPWKEQTEEVSWAQQGLRTGSGPGEKSPHSPWNRGADAATGMVEASDVARLRGAAWVEHVGGWDRNVQTQKVNLSSGVLHSKLHSSLTGLVGTIFLRPTKNITDGSMRINISFLKYNYSLPCCQKLIKKKMKIYQPRKNKTDVAAWTREPLETAGYCHGYRWKHQKCWINGAMTERANVGMLLRLLDGEGVALRSRNRPKTSWPQLWSRPGLGLAWLRQDEAIWDWDFTFTKVIWKE